MQCFTRTSKGRRVSSGGSRPAARDPSENSENRFRYKSKSTLVDKAKALNHKSQTVSAWMCRSSKECCSRPSYDEPRKRSERSEPDSSINTEQSSTAPGTAVDMLSRLRSGDRAVRTISHHTSTQRAEPRSRPLRCSAEVTRSSPRHGPHGWRDYGRAGCRPFRPGDAHPLFPERVRGRLGGHGLRPNHQQGGRLHRHLGSGSHQHDYPRSPTQIETTFHCWSSPARSRQPPRIPTPFRKPTSPRLPRPPPGRFTT